MATPPFFMKLLPSVLGLLLMLAIVGCETTSSSSSLTKTAASKAKSKVVVEGTMWYPDEEKTTFVVPAGAKIIGAGGIDCKYIVEAGGSIEAHSGTRNTYIIKRGGHFRGFTHDAQDCKVRYEDGQTVEIGATGPGTIFEAM